MIDHMQDSYTSEDYRRGSVAKTRWAFNHLTKEQREMLYHVLVNEASRLTRCLRSSKDIDLVATYRDLDAVTVMIDAIQAEGHDLRYSNDRWQIVSPNNAVLFQNNSKRLVIHEFRRLTGIRLSDADFAAAFANRNTISR